MGSGSRRRDVVEVVVAIVVVDVLLIEEEILTTEVRPVVVLVVINALELRPFISARIKARPYHVLEKENIYQNIYDRLCLVHCIHHGQFSRA